MPTPPLATGFRFPLGCRPPVRSGMEPAGVTSHGGAMDELAGESIGTRLLRAPRLWFGFGVPVHRLEFAASGAFLALVKFGLDSALYRAATGKSWSPLGYLLPLGLPRFGELP